MTLEERMREVERELRGLSKEAETQRAAAYEPRVKLVGATFRDAYRNAADMIANALQAGKE